MYLQPGPTARDERASDLAALERLFRKGDYRKVLFRARQGLRQSPGSGWLWALAAAAAARLGLHDEAGRYWQRAVQNLPSGDRLTQLGRFLIENDRHEEAVEVFRRRLAMHPGDAAACAGMGVSLLLISRFPEALTILSEAVRLEPENASYVANLGRAFELAGLIPEARKAFALAADLCETEPDHLVGRARLENLDGDSQAALRTLETATRRWPENAAIMNARGLVLSALGMQAEAEDAFRAAIRANSEDHTAIANLATRRPMADEAEAEARVRWLLQNRADTTETRISLLFTLAKIEEDKKNFEPAYAALTEANRLRCAQLKYDPGSDRRMFAALKREFEDMRPPAPAAGQEGPAPIFITGLPRSGTTLTESILARHPDVGPLGERDALMHAVRRNWLAPGRAGADKAMSVAADYRASLPLSVQDMGFVTDKMPLNFRFIGHIAMSMPDARIVHVTRDPRATCWSIFRQNFSGSGNAFAYDPDDIVGYFTLYRDLMKHWENRFPGRIATLDYDALVKDQRAETQRFVENLGLAWDEACLSPEKAGRSVLTASSGQVRRKVYSGSSLQWRRYKGYAGHWLNRLDQVP